MHELQEKLKDHIQIILVNTYEGDTITRVKSFFEKRKKRTGMEVKLPYSLVQENLTKYFNYKFIPHYVWIDSMGVIVAITSQAEISEENLISVIKGNPKNLHTKIDLVDFDKSKPLFLKGNGGIGEHLIYRSIITSYTEGIGNSIGMQRDKNDKIIRFYMLNVSPLMMLRMAYPDVMNKPPNRILNRASAKFIFENNSTQDTLFYKNSICYEIILPPTSLETFREYIKGDISRTFGVAAKNETIQLESLVVNRPYINNDISKHPSEMELAEESKEKYIRNLPQSTLVDFLNQLPAFKQLPVIDETIKPYNIEIAIPSNIYNLTASEIEDFLKENGFRTRKTHMDVKVAIIQQMNN
jgi:hypothetical protein